MKFDIYIKNIKNILRIFFFFLSSHVVLMFESNFASKSFKNIQNLPKKNIQLVNY